ncbi:AtpZ/AtpI family protein [Methylovirgula sp. 4M-Z18]|uniref:AtpZ/AtpI family protein n=1 Tax=Methylovirgula sp. 4M-Z18 TaxID=2293567 RepID=UPI000E2FE111|nr:AtpZ/AtpI family protein [Methylovirgula sp. 4M-Z18]RFB78872.1 ATP F0F1 synthase subunit I [Methylovirgula sp. 4M-Z18]
MGKSEDTEREDAALRARLANLSNALEQQRQSQEEAEAGGPLKSGESGRALNMAFRVLAEFVAGILVGVFLGWVFDSWLGTWPFMLIVFSMLGMLSGFWNIYRIAVAQQKGNS